MNYKIMRRCLIAVLTFGFGFVSPAQQRGNVEIVVRNQQGDSLPFARVKVTGSGNDVGTRANARGRVTVSLNYGVVHVVVSTLGYQSSERNVTVDRASIVSEYTLQAVPRQLSEVEVREPWVGIRGGIADAETRQPIAGVAIASRLGNVKLVTDKTGRFEIPMYEAMPMVLQLSKLGYQVRPAQVEVREDGPTDVVFFMTPGRNIKGERTRLSQLDRRVKANNFYAFILSGAELRATKREWLYDALEVAPSLMKNHMRMGTVMCLYVDGLPRPNFPLNSRAVADIDFVEIIGQGQEVTMTFEPSKCFDHEAHNPSLGINGSRFIGIVSVWTRK